MSVIVNYLSVNFIIGDFAKPFLNASLKPFLRFYMFAVFSTPTIPSQNIPLSLINDSDRRGLLGPAEVLVMNCEIILICYSS